MVCSSLIMVIVCFSVLIFDGLGMQLWDAWPFIRHNDTSDSKKKDDDRRRTLDSGIE
jgi:hypothetical protein